MNKRIILLIFLAAFLGSMFAQVLGFGAVIWYQTERSQVLSLGNKPSVEFCQLSAWLGYYGFTHEEQSQCENILHPKIRPDPISPVEG